MSIINYFFNHLSSFIIKMSAPPFEPIVVNSGFETGLLAPWIPSDPAAATIANGTLAYTGDYYL